MTPEAERRAVRERRRIPVPARGTTDALLLPLAKLLAVLTGVFVGLFAAYFISFVFIEPQKELIEKARQVISDTQTQVSALEPELTRADTQYRKLKTFEESAIRDGLRDTSTPLAQPDSAAPAPSAEPPPPATGQAAPGAPPAAPPQVVPPPILPPALPKAALQRVDKAALAKAEDDFKKADNQMKRLTSTISSWQRDLADYQRTIVILNLLSFAVVVIMGLLGYLLYPFYFRWLQNSSAEWSSLFVQRSLRSGPLLIGFVAGISLAVLLLLAVFTTISTQYTFLSLPPFRLAFGAFVTVALGICGALVGGSYFSPPPPEPDPFKDYRRAAPPSLLDSSVLIDGRIYEVAVNGFIGGVLVVPLSVLDELQALADSNDERKRGKGKRGLDMVNKVKSDTRLDVMIYDDSSFDRQGRGTDEHLIRVAQAMAGHVVTNDFNLNRVASARDVRVINLNALANAVKTNHVPGDFIEIDIADRGKQRGQGVGYLPDGTMVVIEDGEPHIGKLKTIKLTSISQTQAGRLLFGRVDAAEGELGGNGRYPGAGGHGGNGGPSGGGR